MKKHLLTNIAQVIFTTALIYNGVVNGLSQDWIKMSIVIIGLVFSIFAFHYFRYMEDIS